MIEDGVVGELLLGRKYGHKLHFWDLRRRRHIQEVDLGDEHQMVLELRPAHDPTKSRGFAGVVVSVEDLSASIWIWHRSASGDAWEATKVITIPAEPADPALLLPVIAPFGAVPPLVTDIDLSVDDQWLYVSCWGTGELKRYDVSDPFHPKEAGSVRIGGIVGTVAHPSAPDEPLRGGPQMVEVSRDGKRVYVSNSLYGSWDDQFYPAGVGAWLAKLDSTPDSFAVTASAITSRAVTIGAGAVLVAMGLWRLLSKRHFRWVGMKLTPWELGTWSFLMFSVHGAGLMLVPVLATHQHAAVPASPGWAAVATLLHTATMLLTAGVVAVLVLRVLGLGVLRRAWINVDRIWAVALIGAGAGAARTH